jgi:predicted DNA-binding transcriptional regulator AlpA
MLANGNEGEQPAMTTIEVMASYYVPRAELARKLGKSEGTLIRWEKDGKGPPVTRIGRDVKYYIPSVEKWLRSQERGDNAA